MSVWCGCARPGGAFYAFANITGTGMDSKTAADFLLNEAGTDFSKHGWRAFVLMMALAIFVFAAFSLFF
jgi:aspartate/methionine/tyrosine aminotransferase